jgi:hypothetical protein
VAATATQLRQWVDTAAEKEYLLLHARVEAAAGRCAVRQWHVLKLQWRSRSCWPSPVGLLLPHAALPTRALFCHRTVSNLLIYAHVMQACCRAHCAGQAAVLLCQHNVAFDLLLSSPSCRPAAALTALDKLLSPSDEVPGAAAPEASQLKRKLLQQLGWQHWKAYDEAWARVKFPAQLPPL